MGAPIVKGRRARRRVQAGEQLRALADRVAERLEGGAVRALTYGRIVMGATATADGASWSVKLAPCGHSVTRKRHGDRFTLPVAVCEVCEAADEVRG